MEVMAPASDAPVWLVPAILIGFPVVFVGFWSLISALLAVVSGYRSLLGFRLDGTELEAATPLPTPLYAMIGIVSYRGGILSLAASSLGLTLRVSRLFPFHPPIRVPWARIQEAESGGFLGRLAGVALLLDGRVRLRLPETTLTAIRDARARWE